MQALHDNDMYTIPCLVYNIPNSLHGLLIKKASFSFGAHESVILCSR